MQGLEAEAISAHFKTMMQGKALPESEKADMEDLEALQGVCKLPVRIKCALLGWSTLLEGIQAYRAKQKAPKAKR